MLNTIPMFYLIPYFGGLVHYTSGIRYQLPVKCDTQPAESRFQTRLRQIFKILTKKGCDRMGHTDYVHSDLNWQGWTIKTSCQGFFICNFRKNGFYLKINEWRINYDYSKI